MKWFSSWALFVLVGLTLAAPAEATAARAAGGRKSRGTGESVPATIVAEMSNPTIAFAAGELKMFLEKISNLKFVERGKFKGARGWRFELSVDPKLAPFAIRVAAMPATPDGPITIALSGHTAREVLDAVYTALERTGIVFDVDGPILPAKADLQKLPGFSGTISPAVARRGIRQHINFPMDISSYPLGEALEYLRNLTRMRMNHITFHSYPGQWYSVKYPDGRQMLAGEFFYGTRFNVPDHPVVKKLVRNKKVFCPPEIEPYFDQPAEKSRRAEEWLRTLIAEAKRMGMHVQFSFELREAKMENSLATAESIVALYPQIDTLEIITGENGGGGPKKVTTAELKKTIAQYYGEAAAADPALAPLLTDETNTLTDMLRELGHNTQVVKELQKRWAGQRKPALAIGIYATPRQYLALALTLMRKYLPPDVSYDFMPSHGAREAAENIKAMPLTKADWQRMLVSSWAEFDGNMYLQENEIQGIYQLLGLAQDALGRDEPMFGLAVNHWRSAENRTTLRYASQAFLRGPVPLKVFYREYAGQLGLGKPEQYAAAMQELDDLQTWLWKNIPAVGFCISDTYSIPMMSWWEPAREDEAIRRFGTALAGLQASARATSTSRGRQYLALLQNRVQCSILHLSALRKLRELKPLWDLKDPAKLSAAQRAQVLKVCDEAAPLAEQYLKLYASLHPDRGVEGTVIDYYYCVPAMIKKMRVEWGGAREETVKAAPGNDAPPVPVSNR